jgi:pyruvate-ferredoxin/flavodoxin oxidoreductase
MSSLNRRISDANEAVASVAYQLSEIIAIYPITPSSPMAEWCDEWAAQGRNNLWNVVPEVVQMQSEGGVAGAVHGSLQGGVLTTTFTASQGLLLMTPNMYKIAGEFLPFCLHVSARSLATHALSIFGDHSDVMACRQTGFAMLASNSVQEAHDMAAIAHTSTLDARVPFLHFFDGFRTSHEVNSYRALDDSVLHQLMTYEFLLAFRSRGMTPDAPVVRGTAQNPDVFFQGRERGNLMYANTYGIVEGKMKLFGKLTGRFYKPFEYVGSPFAERVVVLMGSGAETVEKVVVALCREDEKVGVLKVRLFRPFSTKHFLNCMPKTVSHIAVLDRTKEPGAVAEPLCQDVISAYFDGVRSGWVSVNQMPMIVGGRYGLSSKEFTPAMAKAVFDMLKQKELRHSFTVGIIDDFSHSSLEIQKFEVVEEGVFGAIFYGLGSDGTVGANKNTVRIVGEETDRFVQAYFVYDSKKAGAMTISHLRFSPREIHSPYLINNAQFVACHQFSFLDRYEMLDEIREGGTFLLNAPFSKEKVWDALPEEVQRVIVDKHLKLYTIDAYRVAREANMGIRINTVMQTCFFAISGILPQDEAIAHIKKAIQKTYGRKGEAVVQQNFAAVDATLNNLYAVDVPNVVTAQHKRSEFAVDDPSEFLKQTTKRLLEQKGDLLPVSAIPLDGTWPTATTRFEKRNVAQDLPTWDPKNCIQCNRCILVCPHACLRAKFFPNEALADAPKGFHAAEFRSKVHDDHHYTVQLYPEDCTGCGLCANICPLKDKKNSPLRMVPKGEVFVEEKENCSFFDTLPWPAATDDGVDVKGTQFRRPLFEFSGACAGCGETPYIKLLTQLVGDRLLVANATGCSSIYGGNLPTTPYCKDDCGRGPAWANSLFEDNAEFGLGIRLAVEKKTQIARHHLELLAPKLGDDFVQSILTADQSHQSGIAAQRERIDELQRRLLSLPTEEILGLQSLMDFLVEKSVWIVGGDGWAYDIGYGGLDHVLASGYKVNVLVLDTEVYSNTGGQQSKATSIGAIAKFAASGKDRPKKDLGLLAMIYGNVYVAQIAIGANPAQAINALAEANNYPGPSLIIAYSHCVEHGYPLKDGLSQQVAAVDSGYWILYRFDPRKAVESHSGLQLDSGAPKIPLRDYLCRENRYRMLKSNDSQRSRALLRMAQEHVDRRFAFYEKLALQRPTSAG